MKRFSIPYTSSRSVPPPSYEENKFPSSNEQKPPANKKFSGVFWRGSSERKPAALRDPSASRFTQFTESARQFLHALHEATLKIGKLTYSSDPAVAPKAGEEGCVEATMVKVRFKTDVQLTEHAIDANYVAFTEGDAASQGSRYIAGRSPMQAAATSASAELARENFIEYEKILVQGIESGKGVFQFVGHRAHHTPEQSPEKPIISELLAMQDMVQRGGGELILGGRYQVDQMELVNLQHCADMNDHRHHVLKVTDVATNEKLEVPLTQAYVPFANGILQVPAIVQADAILTAHNKLTQHREASATDSVPVNAIFSTKGVIRNATLMTYAELSRRIDNGHINDILSLDQALQKSIIEGRKARGIKKFIPSTTQIDLLRTALLQKLNERLGNERFNEIDSRLNPAAPVQDPVPRRKIPDRDIFGQRSAVTNERTRAFSQHAFVRRDNDGGGSCLFHALEGTAKKPNLSKSEVKKIRRKVAYVREIDTTDTNAIVRRGNFLSLLDEYRNRHNKALEKFLFRASAGKPLEEITNKEYAECQKSQWLYAGNDEIQQWLAIEGNHEKTIVVVDLQDDDAEEPGKCIVVFKYGHKPQITQLSDIQGNEHDVSRVISQALHLAIQQEQDSSQNGSAKAIALHRTHSHFTRIVGHNSPAETTEAYFKWEAAMRAYDKRVS